MGDFLRCPFVFSFEDELLLRANKNRWQKLGSIQKNTYEILTIICNSCEILTILGAEFEPASSIGRHILRVALFVYIHAEVMQHHMVILAKPHKINEEIDKLTSQFFASTTVAGPSICF